MDKTLRRIDVLLFDGFNLLDVAGPVQAFTEASISGRHAYKLRFISDDGETVMSSCGLPVQTVARPSRPRLNTDLLIPGGEGIDNAIQDDSLRRFLAKYQSKPGKRLVSVCSGALLLANAGLLDNRSATTHWSREQQVTQLFPKVDWVLNQIYVCDGPIYSSAGVTTGIDLALAIIREDCGGHAALAVARELVVTIKRSGGQTQYADLLESQLCADDAVAKLISLLQQHPGRIWTLDSMAESVGMTARTLSRKCGNSTGMSPVKLLEKIRVSIASDMLSDGQLPQRVLTKAGFSNEQSMQRGFKRCLGVTVGDYVKKFGVAQGFRRGTIKFS